MFEDICRGIGALRTVRAEQFENTSRREQPAVPFCRALCKIRNAAGGLLFFASPFGAAEDYLLFAPLVKNGNVLARLYVDVSLIVEYLNGILFFGLCAVEFDVQRTLFYLSARLFVHIDIVVLGVVLEHLAEVGVLVQFSVNELYIAVGIFLDERYLVRYHHDELGLGDLFENVHDLHGVFRVEVARRFVGKDYVRALDERAGYGYPLFLPSGERVTLFILEPLHVHERQNLLAPPLYLPLVLKSRDVHGIAHDLGDGIAAFEVVILEDKPYFCVADLIHFTRHIFAVDIYFSAVLPVKPADDVEERGLAAARFAVYGDKAFFGKLEGDAFQHLVAVTRAGIEYFADIFDFYHKHTPLF